MAPEILSTEPAEVILGLITSEATQLTQQREDATEKADRRMKYYLDVLFKKYPQVKFVSFNIYPADYSDGDVSSANSDVDDCKFNGINHDDVLEWFELEPGADITSASREMVWSDEQRCSIPNPNLNQDNVDIVKAFQAVLQFKTLEEWIEDVGDSCTVLVEPSGIRTHENYCY